MHSADTFMQFYLTATLKRKSSYKCDFYMSLLTALEEFFPPLVQAFFVTPLGATGGETAP